METKSYQNLDDSPLLSRIAAAGGLKRSRATLHKSCEQASAERERSIVFVDDDNRSIREAMQDLLEEHGYVVQLFADCSSFREAYRAGRSGCLLVDAMLPGMSGIELIEHLKAEGQELPAIVISGRAGVPMAVKAMKAGAADFIEKPVACKQLLESIERVLAEFEETDRLAEFGKAASVRLSKLTLRQRQILELVLDGQPSKNIAADLGISQRTVENHRAAIMRRTSCRSIPALMHTAFCARCNQGNAHVVQRPTLQSSQAGSFAF